MVIEIDTGNDTPEQIAEKLESLHQAKQEEKDKLSLAHLCGTVNWGEDAVLYQKRLRNEWE